MNAKYRDCVSTVVILFGVKPPGKFKPIPKFVLTYACDTASAC